MPRSASLLLLNSLSGRQNNFHELCKRTLLYLLISRTRILKVSSTLCRTLADVSINLQPKCFARSRPSRKVVINLEKLRRLEPTICTDLSFIFQVTLVCHDNNRDIILILHAQYLLVENVDFLEGVARGNRVYKQKTLPSPHILLSHSTINSISQVKANVACATGKDILVFFLTCSVEDIKKGDLVVDNALFSV